MLTLRKTIFLIILWTSILALFTTHLILTKHGHGIDEILHTHTKKSMILELPEVFPSPNPLVGDTVKNGERAESESEHLNNATRVVDSSPKVKLDLFLEERELQRKLKEENKKLKQEIQKAYLQIDDMKQKKKQLKLLVRRLALQNGRNNENAPKLDPTLPWVFAITPTFTRFTQKADLVRLSQTLQHVPNLHWIIVEDSKDSTSLVKSLLVESGLSFTHLNTRTPAVMQRKRGEKYNKHHRGVPQRNLGLKWIRRNINPEKTPGVVYFMDDDNTYHKQIFEEMRWTKKVSVWPVALTGGARWAGPLVLNGKVTGFHTNWAKDRTFPIDMSAFAVNLDVIVNDYPHVNFSELAKRGYLEPTFLSSITTVEDLEPMAENCTKIYVWHTRTESPKESIKGEKKLVAAGIPSNPSIES